MLLLLVLTASIVSTGEWVAIDVVATAYCPCVRCCGARAAGITANNTRVSEEPYGIASDPESLPYGSVVFVPTGVGYLDKSRSTADGREFIVDDTGGIVRRRTRETGRIHIDLRFVQHRNAVKFGTKTITIYLWKE